MLEQGWLISVVILYIAMCAILAGWIPVFLAGGAIFGLASFPVMPVLLELLTRKFDNIPYHVSNTVLFVSSQIFSVLMQTILSNVFDAFPVTAGVICVVVILYMMITMFAFLKDVDNDVS